MFRHVLLSLVIPVVVLGSRCPDYDVMMDLYKATGGANWKNNSGWGQTDDCCTWYGVYKCDSSGNVVQLWLNDNRLTGIIPSSLGQLKRPIYIALQANSLTGSIPSSLGNHLYLNELWLNRNKLSGSIPASLGHLKSLIGLELQQNQLTGSIPDLSNIKSLTNLRLSYNKLTGSVPMWIGSMPVLSTLFLEGNQLSALSVDIPMPPKIDGCRFCQYDCENHFPCPIPEWTKKKCHAKCA